MKKLLIASALILGASMAMFSCNNGAYDANPNVDDGAALNPLSPDSGGVSVYLGSMEGVLNNRKLVYAPAFYYVDTAGNTQIIARVKDDSIFHRTLRVTFAPYSGIDTYSVTAGDMNPRVNFVKLDTSRVDLAGRKIYNTYTANTGDKLGYATINIIGEEGGNYRGYLFGKLYRVLPEKQFADTMSLEYTEFYFRKLNWPLPPEYLQYLAN
ncbi:MAG: hypothetical protein H6550_10860 [Chitinophagales bacterium]|nr:hypothetical protein [Chitinophagales bacterium]